MCIFGSRTFVPDSWMCKKQTAVSHSSTESEIISLDAGLRMDGSLAFDLWEIVSEVLRSTNNIVQPKHTSIQGTGATLHSKTKAHRVKRRQKVGQLSDVDYVPNGTIYFSCSTSAISAVSVVPSIYLYIYIYIYHLD